VALSAGAGHRFFAALARSNEAEAQLRLGRLDDALVAINEAIETYTALGSLATAVPHALRAELYRQKGDLIRARVAFERSLALADQHDDSHTLVYALSGLARTLAPEDRERARQAARQAVDRSTGIERSDALCALAEVELWAGDHAAAGEWAERAAAESRRTANRAGLAEALELRAAAQRPPDETGLHAAQALWDEIANPIAAARSRLALATLRGQPDEAERARGQLRDFGAAPGVGVAALLGSHRGAAAAITTLGRFSVVCDGETRPLAAWQSRKARDLLKLLVARRGHPITREAAADAMWPDQMGDRIGNRLSVALSTVRKVLDPDRRHPSDYYVVADGQSLALRLPHLDIDVVTFLDLVRQAGDLMTGLDRSGAEATLHRAQELYAGDFLEEDLYEDWAVDCREEARSAALTALRLLARLAAGRGDDEAVSQHLGQLLDRDPYDENAWLALVAAQLRLRRHGEARRRYATYARRMAELDVVPVPLAEAGDRSP
jgi:DNA-binding SARP family transcriptional activator